MTSNKGKIIMYIGCMYARKTSHMIDRIKTEAYAGKHSIICKWKMDTRYSSENVIITHDDIKLSDLEETDDRASIKIVSAEKLSDIKVSPDIQVIGIDEGQFYPDLIEMCNKWADMGYIVVISALDATYKRTAFKQVVELIPMAEEVHKLFSVCMECRKERASFTSRTIKNNSLIFVGTKKDYKATCRTCWNKLYAVYNEEEETLLSLPTVS